MNANKQKIEELHSFSIVFGIHLVCAGAIFRRARTISLKVLSSDKAP